jgi:hypothetical protein
MIQSVRFSGKIGEINMTDEWLFDSDLGEALHENEIEIAQQIAESIATTIRQRYAEHATHIRT